MSISALQKALLGKIEITPGIDAAPLAAADAIRVVSSTVSMDVSAIEYDAVKQTFGKRVGPIDARAMSLDVEFYMRSGGGLGISPDFSPLLHAASHALLVNAGISVVINPITAQGAARHTATFHYYEDGLLYKFIGAVATSFSVDFPLDGLVRAKISLIAPFLTPTASSLPVGLSYQSSQPIHPQPSDVITDAGVAIRVGTFSFDSGVAGAVRRFIGGSEANVTGRDRSKISISKDSLGTIGDVTRLMSITAGAFSSVVGVAGNRLSLTSPKAFYGSLKSDTQDALMMRTIDLLLEETLGDDAYQVILD